MKRIIQLILLLLLFISCKKELNIQPKYSNFETDLEARNIFGKVREFSQFRANFKGSDRNQTEKPIINLKESFTEHGSLKKSEYFDLFGKTERTTENFYDGNGYLLKQVNLNEYYPQKMVEELIDSDSINRTESRKITINDTLNYKFFLKFDEHGKVKQQLKIEKNDTIIVNFIYKYDSRDNLIRSEQVEGNNISINEFKYDDNGNLTKDKNKGITNVVYNHLNMPIRIVFGSASNMIKYRYDASGVKLQKEVIENGNPIVTKYANGFIYEEDELQFFEQPEGYVQNNNGTFSYVYSYLDHLGNIRLNYSDLDENGSIDPSTEILDEKNYYPGGLVHQGYNTGINGTYHPYGFNGKEENNELDLNTLDFGARNYDPALVRWMNIDPLAEKMTRHSPYNYAFNNPIYFIDPDGMEPLDWIKNLETGVVRWYDETGDKAIEKAVIDNRENISIKNPTDSEKKNFKNLGASYFGSKGENPSDNAQIKEQQEAYLTEVASALNAEAGVDYNSEKLGSGASGNITQNVLESFFMGSKNGGKSSKESGIISDIKSEVVSNSRDDMMEYVMEKGFRISSRVASAVTMALTTTSTNGGTDKNVVNAVKARQEARQAFKTKVMPLLTTETMMNISTHQYKK